MIQLNVMDNAYVNEGLAGFTKKLTEDGLAERQVDLLVVGAAYAISHRIAPPDTIKRHDLARVGILHPDVRFAFEIALPWFARELRLPPPENERDLMDLLARAGSAGLEVLRREWSALSPGQVRFRLLGLAARNPAHAGGNTHERLPVDVPDSNDSTTKRLIE